MDTELWSFTGKYKHGDSFIDISGGIHVEQGGFFTGSLSYQDLNERFDVTGIFGDSLQLCTIQSIPSLSLPLFIDSHAESTRSNKKRQYSGWVLPIPENIALINNNIDDLTFRYCASRIVHYMHNTSEGRKSRMRLDLNLEKI